MHRLSSVTSADDAPIRREAMVPLPGAVPSHSTLRAPGRIRGATLPQEYDLARFVENMEGLHPTWCTNVTACEWAGVTCNDMGEVTAINWTTTYALSGSVLWKYLPLTLMALHLRNSEVTGNVELDCLPKQLKTLALSDNRFFGQVDTQMLPRMLETAYFDHNEFTGHVNLSTLPPNLVELWLESNHFEGEVDLCHLPLTLRVLDFSLNQFSGTLDFRNLPDCLSELYANDNNFELLINVEHWPKDIYYCWLKDNTNLCGCMRLADLPKGIVLEVENTQIDVV